MAFARGGRLSDYQSAQWLNQFVTTAPYLGLFSSDPFVAGTPGSVEIVGAGYSRMVPTFTLSGRLLTATNVLLWQGIPQGAQVTHIGGWDAAFNGNFLFAGPVPASLTPISFPSGGYLQLAANSYHLGLDS